MIKYILKRLLLIIPTFIGITIITYSMVRLAPGDYTSVKAGMQGELKAGDVAAELMQQERKLFGLDKPWYVGYFDWLTKFAGGDFGVSRKDKRPVIDRLGDALPITLVLNIISILIMYIISVPLGIYSAVNKDSSFDRISGLVLFILYSLPHFWIGLLLLLFFSGGDFLNLFPLGGRISDWAENAGFFTRYANMAWHLFLPVVTLTYGSLAFLSRYSRANMLEVINQQYIITAKAKGLSNRRVIFVHAFRNSLIPLITLMGSLLPALLGGSVIVEMIFSIPGMGMLAYEAILSRDIPVIMAITSISALLTLAGILLSDIAYGIADPRIRLEAKL